MRYNVTNLVPNENAMWCMEAVCETWLTSQWRGMNVSVISNIYSKYKL